MYYLGLLAQQQTIYSTLHIQDSAGCAITSLSERVSYSDYVTGCKIMGFGPQQRHAIFHFSEMSRQAVGPPSLLFKLYRNSSLGVKWPGHGDVPLLPHCAFMAWIRQLSLIQDSTVEGCNKPCL